jgi:hypothetical protein
MKQEGIRDFLNLPGIVSVALMDGQSQPFFADLDRAFNLQQKEALSQGVLQVIETIPEGFESFEFQFSAYQVYIYKLIFGRVLLVLARQNLDYSDYSQKIEFVREAIQTDFEGAIATLRTLTVSQTPDEPIGKPQPQPSSATLQDVLAAFDHLSRFTTQYLGIPVIVNYLKSTRPDQEWLQQFQIDRAAHISFSSIESDMTQPLSDEQQQWIRDWMAAFIRRCSQAVRDFATIVEQKALNPQQKALLLP